MHVNVLVLHTNAEIVEEVQDVATLLECASDSSKAGDVDHYFASFCSHLSRSLLIIKPLLRVIFIRIIANTRDIIAILRQART